MSSTESVAEPITRETIRNKFAELTGNIDSTASAAQAPLLGAGAVLVVILTVLAYWLGKRKGRASRTVVEVRRV